MQAEFHSAHEVGERTFKCGSCSHQRRASVTGLGEGVATFLNSEGTGARRAREDAMKDIDATLAVTACPSCGVRNRGALFRWWFRNLGLPVIIFGAVMAGCAFAPMVFDLNMREEDQRIVVWVMLGIGLFVLALMLPLPLSMKWSSVKARVTWLP